MATKKRIFYFEDDSELLDDFIAVLQSMYTLEVGANWTSVEQPRTAPVDLVIVDLMIHHSDSPKEKGKENIAFPGVPWLQTGIEFIKQLRNGSYESFGLSSEVPVIIASASVSYPVQKEAESLGIKQYLEKPFTLDELERAVNKALQMDSESKWTIEERYEKRN